MFDAKYNIKYIKNLTLQNKNYQLFSKHMK